MYIKNSDFNICSRDIGIKILDNILLYMENKFERKFKSELLSKKFNFKLNDYLNTIDYFKH